MGDFLEKFKQFSGRGSKMDCLYKKKGVLQYARALFWNFGIALHCYCGDNVKYGLLSKQLFQRKQQNGGWKNAQVTTKFYKKRCLPVITCNRKHTSKQIASVKYTLEKSFFAAATFEGLWVVSVWTE